MNDKELKSARATSGDKALVDLQKTLEFQYYYKHDGCQAKQHKLGRLW